MKCDVFHFVYFLPAGSARRAALPVFRLLTGRFGGFRPAGATRCTDQGEIWQGGADQRSSFTLIGPGVGVYGPKTEKNGILPI